MKNRSRFAFLFVLVIAVLVPAAALARTIRVPADATLSGTVLIAETFFQTVKGQNEPVPLEFEAWQGGVMRPSTWFHVRIEAHPGDVLVLAPGQYKADLWIFTPGITITTDPDATSRADIWGTVEIDADAVTLDHVAVTGPRKDSSSGHGVELNRGPISTVTVRDCVMKDNEWTGIHIIGAHGTIQELRVENCTLEHNGMDGMDDQSTVHLIVTGCTIIDNGWNFDHGVGVRLGFGVEHVTMTDNDISSNRYADISGKANDQ